MKATPMDLTTHNPPPFHSNWRASRPVLVFLISDIESSVRTIIRQKSGIGRLLVSREQSLKSVAAPREQLGVIGCF
jgi:hypothetical protein